ncbi:transporter substrate-binding domain-containing protein [Maricurvus nonylphenolicus]
MDSRGMAAWVAVMCLLSWSVIAAPPVTVPVIYPQPEFSDDDRQHYPIELLELALTYSGKNYLLQPSELISSQLRALKKLESGKGVDVVWTMTSAKREERIRPIRIPIDKGLFGWRVPLIREADTGRFEGIHNRESVQALLAGQGHDWPDVGILRHNDFRVVTSGSYLGLFKMLASGRIDYFPRSIVEIWIEKEHHPDKHLQVDSNLLLIYPTAFYFFVHKDNQVLARDIEVGLEKLIANGEFNKLFDRHYGDYIQRAKLSQRRAFKLDNPLLPQETPLDRAELWLQLEP